MRSLKVLKTIKRKRLIHFSKETEKSLKAETCPAAEKNKAARSVLNFLINNRDVLKIADMAMAAEPVAQYLSDVYMAFEEDLPDWYYELENGLRTLEKTKKYKPYLKKHYVKEVFPSLYAELAKAPVEDKVIMLEEDYSPSPSSAYLGEAIEAQGKYEVKYIGLRLREVPRSMYYVFAERFIRELATSKALFLSTINDLLSQFDLREETKLIQLWHGVGTFKHVGFSTVDNKYFGRSQKRWDEYNSYRNYSCVTTASKDQEWIFKQAMHLSEDKILPVGVSRTDVFFDKDRIDLAYRKLVDRFPQVKGKKIIFYAPTFRGSVEHGTAPDRLDIGEMQKGLSDEYVLLIKHHGLALDRPEIPEEYSESFAFDMNANAILNIEELLMIADILITDYSSVAFEYAITERPMIFFVHDLEDYVEKRGLYFDFEKDAPGPICRETSEIVKFIEDIDDQFDKEKLLAFKEKYASACDGHATERTIALIEQ